MQISFRFDAILSHIIKISRIRLSREIRDPMVDIIFHGRKVSG